MYRFEENSFVKDYSKSFILQSLLSVTVSIKQQLTINTNKNNKCNNNGKGYFKMIVQIYFCFIIMSMETIQY